MAGTVTMIDLVSKLPEAVLLGLFAAISLLLVLQRTRRVTTWCGSSRPVRMAKRRSNFGIPLFP